MSASIPGKDRIGSPSEPAGPMELFTDGKIDAFLGFPPEPQELRAQHIGRVIVNSARRPARGRNISAACWRATGCSSATIRSRPSACCAPSSRPPISASTEPARAARQLVDGGFTPRYDYALQTLEEVPYDKWREYDAEDTIRFYALRLHEVGMIKSNPQKIIADGTDWRFLERAQARAEGVSANGEGGFQMAMMQTRRRFLTAVSLAGAAGFLPPPIRRAQAAERALETTSVRLAKIPVICFAPQYVCEALLRAEGFTDVRYVDTTAATLCEDLGRGRFDFGSHLSLDHIGAIDAGVPITILTGVHAGCYELFAHGEIRGIADLKGKSVGMLGTPLLMDTLAAYVGLDPKADLTVVADPAAKPLELFAEGKLDAYLAFPPEPQELHARKVGHVILRTAVDRPVVAIFLLHAGRQQGIRRPLPGRDEARDPGFSEGRRSVRERARAGGAADRRWRLYRAL